MMHYIDEQHIGSQLSHENIVRFLDHSDESNMRNSYGDEKKVAYIVQELTTGGALIDLLLDNGAMSEDQCKSLFRQIVLGVHHMHSQGIYHKDLKADNILLDDE